MSENLTVCKMLKLKLLSRFAQKLSENLTVLSMAKGLVIPPIIFHENHFTHNLFIFNGIQRLEMWLNWVGGFGTVIALTWA